MYCNQIMALRDAFKGQIQAWASPLLTVAIYLIVKATLFVFFFPTRHVVEVTDLRWVYWNGDKARRAPTVCRLPAWTIRGLQADLPPSPSVDITKGPSMGCVVTDDHRPRSLITAEVNLLWARAALPPRWLLIKNDTPMSTWEKLYSGANHCSPRVSGEGETSLNV